MRERAEAVAQVLVAAYQVEAEAILVDGTWYVVYKGGDGKVLPAMMNKIWIRRHPWPR